MTWRPLYVPHTVHAAWGSFGDRHCGQATVATAVTFHCARRDRVLLRDILRLGTATASYSSSLGPRSGGCAAPEGPGCSVNLLNAAQRASTWWCW